MDTSLRIHETLLRRERRLKKRKYTLTGISTRSYGIYSTSSLLPAVDCGVLQDPPNGVVTFTDTTLGAVATYSCNTGYRREGSNMDRTCLSDKTWSGEEALCESKIDSSLTSCKAELVMFPGQYFVWKGLGQN